MIDKLSVLLLLLLLLLLLRLNVTTTSESKRLLGRSLCRESVAQYIVGGNADLTGGKGSSKKMSFQVFLEDRQRRRRRDCRWQTVPSACSGSWKCTVTDGHAVCGRYIKFGSRRRPKPPPRFYVGDTLKFVHQVCGRLAVLAAVSEN